MKKDLSLAQRVKTLRLSKGLSQTDLGNLVGTVWQNIQNIELGKTRQPRFIAELAKSLGVSVDYLINGDNEVKGATNNSTPFSMVALDAPLLPNSDLEFYVVAVPKNSKLYLPDDATQVARVKQIFISHIS